MSNIHCDIGTVQAKTGSCVELCNAKVRVDDYLTYNSNFSLQQTMSYDVGSINLNLLYFKLPKSPNYYPGNVLKNKSFSNHIILIIVKM